jgi:uncharacterized repeat protein (TIGR01451 family)
MKVKSLFIFFTIITVTILASFALEASRNEVEAATLSLSCSSSTSSSITLRYSYSNATSPAIYRGGTRVAGLPSGSNSGTYTNRGLSAGKSYTYTLRSGNTTRTATCRTSGGTTTTTPRATTTPRTTTTSRTTYPTYSYTPTYAPRAQVTDWKPLMPSYTPTYASPASQTDWKPLMPSYTYAPTPTTTTTPTPTPTPKTVSGTITCVSATENSITISYNLENAENASVFRGTTRVNVIGSGTRSGSFVETGLAPGTSYEFYLRNGLFNYSNQLSRVLCRTESRTISEEKEELYVTKVVRSQERESGWVNSVTVSPGETVSFSIRVTAGESNLNSVELKDILPRNMEYVGNLKIDGTSVSGNIIEGINIGGISRTQSKTITFDARVYPRDYFEVGTTTLTNTARASYSNIVATDTATLSVIKGEVAGPPTEVPTGVTGNTFFDYVLLPFLLTALAFILFRKNIIGLVKKLEDTRREVRAEWI